MKKLFKIFGIIVVTTAMIFTVIGCGNDTTTGGTTTTDVKTTYTLTAGKNPAGLSVTSAKKTDSTVNIVLGGTVVNGVTGAVATDDYPTLAGDLDDDLASKGYSWIALNGILEAGKTYTVKQTNQSLKLYESDTSFDDGIKEDYEIAVPANIEAGDLYYTFLLLNGASPETATIEVTPEGGSKITFKVDWSAVKFGTDVSATYTQLAEDAALVDANLEIESAIQVGSTVTVKLAGEIANEINAAAENTWFNFGENLNEDLANSGYNCVFMTGLLIDGTYSFKQINQSLNLYNSVASNIHDHPGDNVYQQGSPTPVEQHEASYGFLIAGGVSKKTATFERKYEDSADDVTIVVDWSAVTFKAATP